MQQSPLISKVRSWLKKALNHDALLALAITLTVIAAGIALAAYSNQTIPITPDVQAHYQAESWTHLNFLSNWDGPIYLRISQHGYATGETGFFPLYPLLVHLVTYVLRSPLVSALAVAWLAMWGAVYYYLQIARTMLRVTKKRQLVEAVLPFVLFPTGVFLFATYTESLLALCTLAAVYNALKKRPLLAGAWAMLASATHLEGIFIILFIVLTLYRQGERHWRIALSAVMGSLGLAAYMIFLNLKFHNPVQFLSDQRHNAWLNGNYLHQLATSATAFGIICFLLLCVSIVYWWPRWRRMALYSLLFLLIPLAGGNFGGFSRYCLVVFPAQLMLFKHFRARQLAYLILIAFMSIAWAFYVIHYAAGYTGGA